VKASARKAFFSEEKNQKTFLTGCAEGSINGRTNLPSPDLIKSKVFCFFFSKKKRFLLGVLGALVVNLLPYLPNFPLQSAA
jgi:hypothetical protein